MVKVDIMERKATVEGESVFVNSSIKETMTHEDMANTYMQTGAQIQQIEAQLAQKKSDIKELLGVTETEEDRKIRESLEKAKKIIEKNKMIEEIKTLETNLLKKQNDMKWLAPAMEEIEKARQDTPEGAETQ